ncbi:hypothetical protein L13192_03243 [Pyrenophora tritici-repentis]|uniref:Uncharacterized protein n=1 Tax=Pyrenophora tritici-repentis TaxID=45151 RepID=A0A922NNA1_9PLEO|nr:hypothetical protein Ptr86124_001963 [Pyrenophora tritici-repentis]KAI1672384.1 hypothetical protein L13192_03243 [Pyrenophora tritici-repentis]KAI1686409.1 hypothetical protein KJE20_04374 [Pyrenophora tritici-repentis]
MQRETWTGYEDKATEPRGRSGYSGAATCGARSNQQPPDGDTAAIITIIIWARTAASESCVSSCPASDKKPHHPSDGHGPWAMGHAHARRQHGSKLARSGIIQPIMLSANR